MKRTAFAAALVGAALIMLSGTSYAASPRDCDSNAVVYCGAYTKSELLEKLEKGDTRNSAAELRRIYYSENRGITEASLRSEATVDGVVTRDGRVVVGGRTVATDAISTGRENLGRSTRDGSLFARPTSVSFRSPELPAFVHMENGEFKYAIIKSCGNPVRATPVAKVVPQAAPVALPEAGPALGGLAGLGVLFSTAWTWNRSRRALAQSRRRG